MNEPVWIDTDMGFDDLVAIMTVAAHRPVAGLSLVAGNAPLATVVDNARRASTLFAWAAPLHVGAEKPLLGPLITAQYALGEDAMRTAGRSMPPSQHAVDPVSAVAALSAFLDSATRPATILALGPLTNLALVLAVRPDLASRIGDLVWMGGSLGPGNHTAAAEFNVAVDPEAAQMVLESGVRFRMVGLDCCRQVDVTRDDVTALRALGTERALILADLLAGYVSIRGPDTVSMSLYDPVAAAALVAPGSVAFQPAHIVVECGGQHTRGMTAVELRVPRRATANAEVATVADAARVRAVVLGAMTRAVGETP